MECARLLESRGMAARAYAFASWRGVGASCNASVPFDHDTTGPRSTRCYRKLFTLFRRLVTDVVSLLRAIAGTPENTSDPSLRANRAERQVRDGLSGWQWVGLGTGYC
jgi:hypothetical protein